MKVHTHELWLKSSGNPLGKMFALKHEWWCEASGTKVAMEAALKRCIAWGYKEGTHAKLVEVVK